MELLSAVLSLDAWSFALGVAAVLAVGFVRTLKRRWRERREMREASRVREWWKEEEEER